MPVDKKLFADCIARGISAVDAYKEAGGGGKHVHQAASIYRNKPEVQEMIRQRVSELALDANLAMVSLSPLAIEHMRQVLVSKNPRDHQLKTKVAETVLQRTRDILPREIQISHNHTVQEDFKDSIDELAELLLRHKKEKLGQVIDAVAEYEPRGVPEISSSADEDEDQQ